MITGGHRWRPAIPGVEGPGQYCRDCGKQYAGVAGGPCAPATLDARLRTLQADALALFSDYVAERVRAEDKADARFITRRLETAAHVIGRAVERVYK